MHKEINPMLKEKEISWTCSHAEGHYTTASGLTLKVIKLSGSGYFGGTFTTASLDYQTVVQYNKNYPNGNDTFVVGTG
jgi:hypothetical protein